MSENKTKSKGLSIAMILLVIFLGFGFVIGLTQSSIFKESDTLLKVQIKEFYFNGNTVTDILAIAKILKFHKAILLAQQKTLQGQ